MSSNKGPPQEGSPLVVLGSQGMPGTRLFLVTWQRCRLTRSAPPLLGDLDRGGGSCRPRSSECRCSRETEHLSQAQSVVRRLVDGQHGRRRSCRVPKQDDTGARSGVRAGREATRGRHSLLTRWQEGHCSGANGFQDSAGYGLQVEIRHRVVQWVWR